MNDEATDPDMTDTEINAEPIIHITENGVEGYEILCRLCANHNDQLIPIYSDEGVANDLAHKMNLYLPIKVSKEDPLPLQCCFQCANTVLAWHELMVACVEADRRLKQVQVEVEKQLAQQQEEVEEEEEEVELEEEEEQVIVEVIKTIEEEDDDDDDEEIEEDAKQDEEVEASSRNETVTSIPATAAVTTTTIIAVAAAPDGSVSVEASTDDNEEKPIAEFSGNRSGANINSEQMDISIIKKRDSPSTQSKCKEEEEEDNVKIEDDTDVEWIKTEFILQSDDINPFITDCELTETEMLKISYVPSSENSDIDDSNPEYDPISNDISKSYNCPACGHVYKKLSEMRKHLKLCQESTKELDENSSDDYHPEEDESKDEQKKRQYRCDFCSAYTYRKEDLQKHVQAEHPDKIDNFNEKRQRRRSKLDQDAVDKAKVVVNSRTYYHCDECGKNLHSPYTYIWHNRIHTGERPYVCDLCGKQFRVSQGLVRHLRETHAGIKKFPCDLCGRMFATRRNVEEHRRIHTNERPYICDLCGKTFKQKASLFVHNRSHTDSFPFKCSYCNQGFRTRPPLLVHVTRHTGEKPYACDICGRCFRIKYELKRHRLIHSDDKPFSCTVCGLSFRQKRYLRNHNKVNHNTDKPRHAKVRLTTART